MSTPPLPAGYALDSAPPLPPGYNLDSGAKQKPGVLDKANEYAGKFLGAAGLPSSISDVPSWFTHFVGIAKDSKPAWESIKKAIEQPTQENIVGAVPFFGNAAVAMSKDVRAGDYGGAAATLAGTVGGVAAANQIQPGRQAAANLKNQAAGAAPGSTLSERMYQSSLKPSTKYPMDKVQSMVKTGLEQGIPVSAEGVEKLGGLIDDLNGKIQARIDAGTAAGTTVNRYKVASRLADTYADVSNQANPEKAQTAVGKAGNEFLRNQPTEIPISKAQEVKIGTYRQISKSYGQLSSAAIESQKALARGLKEEIATAFPEIADLNAKESQFIGLDGALQSAVKRITNHQLVGIGTPIAAGAVAGITKSTKLGAIAGVVKAVMDDPVLKSKLAIALNRKGVPLPGAMARIAAYANALTNASPGNDEQANQP